MTTSRSRPTSSAGRRLAGVNRQLGGESPFVGRPRFTAGEISGQVWVFVENARRFDPEQHRHHHQIARTERTIEPVGIAEAGRKLFQPVANAILDQRQALRMPGLVLSNSLAVPSSRIGGSTVLTAANIQATARARALASSGRRPAWRSAICKTIAPVSNRVRSPSS